MRIVVAGGGTAGHVFPALAMADVLRRDHGAQVAFVGSADGQEARLVPAAGYPFLPLRVASAQTRLSLRSLGAIRLTFSAARRCKPLVAGADAVVGIGGYASAPGALAARRTRRPLVLVEPNSVPGAVNRIAARWASAVAVTFEATAAGLPARARVERTGNPIRPEIVAVGRRRAELADEARVVFGLESDRRTILVLGGSQGALHLDRIVSGAIGLLRDRADLQLIVAAGPAHVDLVRAAAGEAEGLVVHTEGFIERMDLALAVADLAVSRAGAGHIAELTVCHVPSILVPYPYATENHQEANARELERAGAAEVVLEAALTPDELVRRVLALAEDGARRETMAAAAGAWARPDADARLAALVASVAGGGGS